MKRLLTLLFACVVTVSLSANPISKENARKSAERFLQQKGIQLGSEAACARGGRTATSHQTLYVFNTVGDRGFVIVSGDDCAESILGYTTRGSYDEATLPENFRDWLDQMSAEIEAASKLPKPIANEGEIVLAPQKVNIHAAVQPLIITTWNQGNTDNVYNAHLPLVSGQYPCTGCVATAGAQVMYYYKWPNSTSKTCLNEAKFISYSQSRDSVKLKNTANTIVASYSGLGNFNQPAILTDDKQIRRLTPLECERLMGFPDNWTALGVDGKAISDSQRYHQCGNAVCPNVIEAVFDEIFSVRGLI